MAASKVPTHRDLPRWLKTLSEEQLGAPILATSGADDFGQTEYVFVTELVEVACDHVQVSGGYEGPILLVGPPQGENGCRHMCASSLSLLRSFDTLPQLPT